MGAFPLTVSSCRQGFLTYYGLTMHHFDKLCANLKRRLIHKLAPYRAVDERTKPTSAIMEDMKREAESFGFKFTVDMESKLQMTNTERAKDAYTWLAWYFQMVGDTVPNGDGEVHIDQTQNFEDIWKEYTGAMLALNKEPLSLSYFARIRNDCFKHVKPREHKAVSAKCETCAHLSELRNTVSIRLLAYDMETAYFTENLRILLLPIRLRALRPAMKSPACTIGIAIRSWPSAPPTTKEGGCVRLNQKDT